MSNSSITQTQQNVNQAGGSSTAPQAQLSANDPALLRNAGHLPASPQVPQLPSEPPADPAYEAAPEVE